MKKYKKEFLKGSVFVVTPVIVANNFIKRSIEENKSLSPLKLQKLVYFLYKDYLKATSNELFSERFETWKYGPVVPSLYFEFSSYGSNQITRFARDSKDNVMTVKEEGQFKKSIERVWEQYKDFSGQALSLKTHGKDTAWTKAKEKKECYLANEDIKNEPEL